MPPPDVNTNAEDVTPDGHERVVDAPYIVRGQATVQGALLVRRSEAGGVLSRASNRAAAVSRNNAVEPTGRTHSGAEQQ